MKTKSIQNKHNNHYGLASISQRWNDDFFQFDKEKEKVRRINKSDNSVDLDMELVSINVIADMY